jgi:hypothetical protein
MPDDGMMLSWVGTEPLPSGAATDRSQNGKSLSALLANQIQQPLSRFSLATHVPNQRSHITVRCDIPYRGPLRVPVGKKSTSNGGACCLHPRGRSGIFTFRSARRWVIDAVECEPLPALIAPNTQAITIAFTLGRLRKPSPSI